MQATSRPFPRWLAVVSGLLGVWLAGPGGGLTARAEENNPVSQYYVVKVLGADDGLTEGSVTDVAQTPEGYLWVGTVFGSVLRFDGTRFASYNSANTPGFTLKWGVPRFAVDRMGSLWINVYDSGMVRWDKRGFHPALNSTNLPGILLWSGNGKVIFSYGTGKLLVAQTHGQEWDWKEVELASGFRRGQHCADAAGNVWFLRNDHELGVWDGQTNRSLPLTGELAKQIVKVVTADGDGNVWIGTDKALAEWQKDHFEVMTPTNGEPVINVKRIIPSGGSLWVEANGRMRRCEGQSWVAESDGWNTELGRYNTLRFLHGDADGGLWSSVDDLGLIHVLPDGTFHRLTTRDGLPSNTIRFAYQDRDGNTWTGYDRGGLVQIRRRLFRSIGHGEGLDDKLINTVSEDAQGAVWIGTHGGIVGRCDGNVCSNVVVPRVADMQDSCVAADAQGRVWIGSQGGGIWLAETGQLQRVVAPEQLKGSPRLLLPAHDGRLWIGTIWTIDSLTGGQLTNEYAAQTPGDHPTALAEAGDGTIWAGTLAGFLLRWDGKQFVALEPPDRNVLGRVWALWPAPDGSVWAGTEEGGLLHWSNGKFRRYTTKSGLPSDSVAQVLGDRQGNLWLGTRAGIVRVPGEAVARFERGEIGELPVSIYGQADGLLSSGSAIIFQPNCWRGRDGDLYFAMVNSVAKVRPEEVHINPQSPTVALEEFRADDRPVWPAQVGAILTASDAVAKPGQPSAIPDLKVGPGNALLEFHYTGLSLGSSTHMRFKYRLAGLEAEWNDAGSERKAVYRQVPPGEYVLHVIAANSDGVWSKDAALLTVTVRPHFYQTALFRVVTAIVAAVGLVAAVVVTMRRRMRRRLDNLRRQHELERERARIAQDLHDDLGAGLTEISLLGGLLQEPSKFSTRKEDALQRIVQRCHDLVVALDEIVWAVNPRNDSVNSLASYLCRYAQGFLEPTAIRGRFEVAEAEPDHPFNAEQRHNLFLAFKEALTNVVRHSKATEVRIKISFAEPGRQFVCLEDNGCGLPPGGSEDGDGLDNLRKRMAQIGGRCEIINRPGGGVTVNLCLPPAR